METNIIMIVGLSTLFICLVFIAFGLMRINSRMDVLKTSDTESIVRINHIEKDVADIKEEQRVISEGYVRQYQDIAVMIRESMQPLERKIENIDNHIRQQSQSQSQGK